MKRSLNKTPIILIAILLVLFVFVQPSYANNSNFVLNFVQDGTVIYSVDILNGSKVTQQDIDQATGKLSVSDKLFSHWSTMEQGQKFDLQSDIQSDLILYAVYTDAVKVSFDAQGGTYTRPVYVKKNSSLDSVLPQNPSKAGYDFLYWALNPNGEKYNISTSLNSNVKLYAVWQAKNSEYTVLYWHEMADSEAYAVADTEKHSAQTGTVANANKKQFPNFTFNASKSDDNVLVKGNGETVVNLYYNRNTFSLDFKNTNGNSLIPTKKVKHGADIRAFANEAMQKIGTNYNWAVPDENYGMNQLNHYIDIPLMPAKDFTLYADKKGSGTGLVQMIDVDTKEVIRSIKHSPKGYIYNVVFTGTNYPIEGFDFQYVNKPGKVSDRFTWEGGSDGIYTVKSYYKRKSYKISFLSNNNQSVQELPNVLYNADISNAAPNNYQVGITKDSAGRTFAGWFSNVSFNGSPVDFSNQKMPAHNLVYYAKWELPKYSLTARPHRNASDEQVFFIQEGEIPKADTQASLKTTPGETDDSFLGWFYQNNGQIERFDFSMPFYENIEIFPLWAQKTYQVSYDLNQATGTIPIDPLRYYSGTKAKLLPLHSDVKGPENRKFAAWAVGSELLKPNDWRTIASNLTVRADWGDIETVTITFNANGGSGNMAAVVVPLGAQYTLPKNEFVAPKRQEFAGWQVMQNIMQTGESFTAVETTELLATWKVKTEHAAPNTIAPTVRKEKPKAIHAPKTCDTSSIGMYILLLLVCSLSSFVIIQKNKKRTN